jgi:hypothetical protein
METLRFCRIVVLIDEANMAMTKMNKVGSPTNHCRAKRWWL